MAFYFGSNNRYLEIALIHGQLVANSLELDSQELQKDRVENGDKGSLKKSCMGGPLWMKLECEDICVPCVCSPRTYKFRETFND